MAKYKDKLYRLADQPTSKESKALGVLDKPCTDDPSVSLPAGMLGKIQLRGVRTGEYRAPKAGEWYLSGAEPEAWKARNDLTSPYYILRLVRVKTEKVTITTIVQEVPSRD